MKNNLILRYSLYVCQTFLCRCPVSLAVQHIVNTFWCVLSFRSLNRTNRPVHYILPYLDAMRAISRIFLAYLSRSKVSFLDNSCPVCSASCHSSRCSRIIWEEGDLLVGAPWPVYTSGNHESVIYSRNATTLLTVCLPSSLFRVLPVVTLHKTVSLVTNGTSFK